MIEEWEDDSEEEYIEEPNCKGVEDP